MNLTKHVLDSAITAATVLSNRAIVTRAGRVKLAAGDNQVSLRDLPANMVENSVRVSGAGPEGARIIGVEMKREYVEEVRDEKVKALEKALEEMAEQETAMKQELDEMNSGLSLLSEFSKAATPTLARGLGRKKVEVPDLDRMVKYIAEQSHDAHARIRAKTAELRNHQKKMQVVRNEHSSLSSMGGKEFNVVNVDIEAAKAGDFDLSVEYAVEGAEWSPLYDARVSTDDMKVDFTYYGMVRQETGENWKSTLITLSTAPEAPSTQLPELQPWYIYGYEPARPGPMKKSQMRFAEGRAMAATAMPMSAPAPEQAPAGGGGEMARDMEMTKVEAQAQVATVATSGETVVYKIEKPADIPSEGEAPKKLTIGKFGLPVEVLYLTIPKAVPEVYTKAKVINDSEFMFLSGQVNLFADAEFIGESSLGSVAPKEKFDFSLGITKAVKVKRELVKREVSSGGVISKDRRIRYAYRIKVENNKKVDAKVTVKDQLPVPRHEKVKVADVVYGEGDEPTKKNDMGIIEWTFTLPPGKKKIIDFEFSLIYPSEFTIEGDVD